MGAIKILANRSFGFVPSVHPNPRVLGEAWSSYGRAKPTQNNPRNKLEQLRKQARKIAQEAAEENTRYNSPVDLTL